MKSYITAIIIALAIIIGGYMLGNAYNYKFKSKNMIGVQGGAQYNFTADLIVWSGTYTRTSMDMKEAYTLLKNDEQQVRSFIATKGIEETEAVFSSITINKQFKPTYNDKGEENGNIFTGYQLSQTVKVESKGIDKVEKTSREISELLQSGIELSSEAPQYYYTKLSDLKIDLLAKASADAYERAATTAKNAHGSLGKLRNASMGVFQITGQYSNEDYSYGGAFNTSSKNKTASITVRLEYELQ